jgi:hypothetical protein
VLAVLQFHSDFILPFASALVVHHPSRILYFGNYRLLRPATTKQSPAPIPLVAGTERRARFSYDDLLELFSFY